MNGRPSLGLGEFDLIAWFRARTEVRGRTVLGIGDDCAVLRPPSGELLVTTDMLMDGRHFRVGRDDPADIGRKALAVNLSDIAAMAGVPIAAVAAVALPRVGAAELAKGIHAGMVALAEEYEVDLVGGDTNAWDGPLVLSLTVLGEAPPGGPVRRSGARPGDAILVTGPLGGSLLGRHLRPVPRVAEARILNHRAPIRAMIDLSDGLSSDLSHILAESGGLGAILDADSIPIHADALAMSRQDGRIPLVHALNDGEDFELCLVVSPEDADRLVQDPLPSAPVYRVGTITAETGLRLRDEDGTLSPLAPLGFDHLRPGPG